MQLNPDSVWLREAGGGVASFFPDQRNESFRFSPDVGYFITRLTVGGVAVTVGGAAVTEAGSSRATTRSSGQVIPVGNATRKIKVKIIQASLKKSASGRPDFKPLSQTFVDVTEATANVNYLSNAVKEKWGRSYVLVTSDAMRLEDSSGTQGKCSLLFHWLCV